MQRCVSSNILIRSFNIRRPVSPLVSWVSRLGTRVGLKFDAAVKGKVRKVRRLVGGLIVFGDRELPSRFMDATALTGGGRRRSLITGTTAVW